MIIPKATSKKVHDQGHIHFDTEKDSELNQALTDIRNKEKEHLIQEDAGVRGIPYISLKSFPISNDALLLLDQAYCAQQRIVTFFFDEGKVRIGAVDPANPAIAAVIKKIADEHRVDAALYQISEESLSIALKHYESIPKVLKSRADGMELTEEALKKAQEKVESVKKLNEVLQRAPTTEVITFIIAAALKAGASDIHIESEAEDVKIRLRIDGMLHDVGVLPKESWGKIISRIKLVGGLKINVADKPQDGRLTIFMDNDKLEVRVSTVPTSYGESVVMRLLRFSVADLAFEKLGLTGFTLAAIEQEIRKPNGMIISTGPTGCGKTTTLYAILHQLNNPGTKILTLEDPIEYKIKGVNQTQVNPAAGLDFAKGLRSLLRQDPDIIMVGEIRDLETADTSINAALTGHLVLSTLHTNSAAGALPRFLAMGSKNFLLAPAINCIIGQRLVRRLCPECKKPEKPSEAILKRINEVLEGIKDRKDLGVDVDLTKLDAITLYTAVGCAKCSDLGYRGRIGIFEILKMNKELEKSILAGNVSEYDVQETAQKSGMITMLQDGLLKVLQGLTSVDEVLRQAE